MFNDYSEVSLRVDLNQFAAELTEEILSALDLDDRIERAAADIDLSDQIRDYVRYDMSIPDEDDVVRIAAEQAIDVFRDEAPHLVREELASALPDALRSLLLSLAAPPPVPAPVPVPEAPAPLKEGDRVLVSGPVAGRESSFPRHGQVCSATVVRTNGEGLTFTMLVRLDVADYDLWVSPEQVRHA